MADDSGVWVKIVPDDFNLSGAPGAAVIDSATHKDPADDTVKPVVATSFIGDGTNGDDGQAYDVYEFLGSGTLNVTTPGMADVLVVGGGGGGGGTAGAGGGAGGLLQESDAYLSQTATVVVGAGGVNGGQGGGVDNPNNAMNGNNGISSSLAGYYGIGGGAGSASQTNASMGSNGGSGGGGAGNTTPPGYGTMGQGNDGGRGNAGGGGGATAKGSDSSGDNGGDGGAGADVSLFVGDTAGSLEIAGGGGGSCTQAGTPGVGTNGGGSGNNGTSGSSTPGQENTGGGGGGGWSVAGSPGGSGLVIVRVKVPTTSFAARSSVTAPKTAHAARIENGVVRQVISIPHLDDDDNKITQYCNSIGLEGTWVDTSYTGSRRGKYAGVGDLFDPNLRNAEFTSPVEVTE